MVETRSKRQIGKTVKPPKDICQRSAQPENLLNTEMDPMINSVDQGGQSAVPVQTSSGLNVNLNELAAMIVQLMNEQQKVNKTSHEGVQLRNDDNIEQRNVHVIPNSNITDVKPEKFNKDMCFDDWIFEFDAYCRILGITEGNKLDTMFLFLDRNIIKEIRVQPNLINNYRELVSYLRSNYNGSMSVQAASDELELLISRKARRIEDIDNIGMRIDKLIEIKLANMNKECKLQSKIESLVKVIPAECRSKFACGKDYTSFDQAIANAKRIWSFDLTAENLRSKGVSLNGNR
uniref:Reverse transcriptase domain-containing protein n=1 Tax=Strongyloides stercoralis TaxID=6248 RepID=A0A0K0ETN4_STRER